MKGWYYASILLMVILFILSLYFCEIGEVYGVFTTLATLLTYIGIMMYHKNKFKATWILFTIAGLLSIPTIGILLIVAGFRIYELSTINNSELNETQRIMEEKVPIGNKISLSEVYVKYKRGDPNFTFTDYASPFVRVLSGGDNRMDLIIIYNNFYEEWKNAKLPFKENEYRDTYISLFGEPPCEYERERSGEKSVIHAEDTDKNISTDSKDTIENKVKFLIQKWLNSKERRIQNYRYMGISTLLGIIIGWYFKLPNKELLIILSKTGALWRKGIILQIYKRDSSFFSTDYFSFNWAVFFLSTLFCYLLMIFFTDDKFRRYLYDKITFIEEKKTT